MVMQIMLENAGLRRSRKLGNRRVSKRLQQSQGFEGMLPRHKNIDVICCNLS
jgi:hypothetical protein